MVTLTSGRHGPDTPPQDTQPHCLGTSELTPCPRAPASFLPFPAAAARDLLGCRVLLPAPAEAPLSQGVSGGNGSHV